MAAGNCVPILAQEAIPVNNKTLGKGVFMSDEIIVSFKPKPGYDLIFRPWYIHPRTKKVVHPKR